MLVSESMTGWKHERQNVQIQQPQIEPEEALDDEDFEEVLVEMHEILSVLIERKQPKYLEKRIKALHERISKAVSWDVLH